MIWWPWIFVATIGGAGFGVFLAYYLNTYAESPGWKSLQDYTPGKDPLHVIGWNSQWGVAEFMRHDDGWTITSFNGQVKRSAPIKWRPLPVSPEHD